MKVFLIPEITHDKEWKLEDFHNDSKWKNRLTGDELLALDIIPMGGELEIIDIMMSKNYKIMRIL